MAKVFEIEIVDPIDPRLIPEPPVQLKDQAPTRTISLRLAKAIVARANPYRDSDGRFGSGPGAKGGVAEEKEVTGYVAGKDLIGEDYSDPMLQAELAESIPWSAAAFEPRSDPKLHEIATKQGFDGPAKLVDQEEFDKIVSQSGYDRFRGIGAYNNANGEVISGEKITTEFATGAYYAGTGKSGNGTYTTWKVDTAGAYASKNPGGQVVRMALLPGSKVATPDQVNSVLDAMRSPSNPPGLDIGRILAAKGFDAYPSVGNGVPSTIVLNRTALAVLKP